MGNKPSSHYEAVGDENTVFISKENDVYRIPALFYDRDRNILMAFAEKRKTSNDASAVALVMKTGTVNKDETTHEVTVKWSELKLVKEAHIEGHRPMNPCPLYDKNSKTLYLFFICVEGTVSECWQLFFNRNKARLCYITTKDAGQSWSEVTDLTDKLDEIKSWATFAVGPGHGIQTEGGRLIVPVYGYASCSPSCCCLIKFYCCTPYALYLYSDDQGKTWQFSGRIQKVSLECEMAEVSDDTGLKSIYCNARSKGGHRVEALDKNNGAGFITLPPTDKLVETGGGCQGSVVSFPAQSEDAHADSDLSQIPNKWLLFTHPSSKSTRTDLAVYLNKSPQDPNAWSKPWIINKGPSAYSDLAYIDDGWFACLMERGEVSEIEQIACKLFSYQEVKQGIGEWIPALLYERESKTLLVFAEQRRTSDDTSSVNLVMATGKVKTEVPSESMTIEWSELKPVEEAHIDGHRPMNPCPLYEKTSKTLFLFFICVEGTVSEQWQIDYNINKARLCYITSKNLGQSWSEVTDLTDKLDEIKHWVTFAVGPGHGLQTESGRLIVPVYAYVKRWMQRPPPHGLALYSDDHGEKWQFGKKLQSGSLECEMAEYFDDKGNSIIYCNARSNIESRKEAVSCDEKLNFKSSNGKKLVETHKGCQGSVVSFPAQCGDRGQSQNPNKWLLFTHPSSKCKRTDLGVYLNKSPQDPKAWSKPWIINKGPSGYSDLAYIDDGWFACLMERGEVSEIEQIACKVFSYQEVKQGIGE
ncbi:uncharacterized protein LKV04_001640 [Tautogolabrus adspersus]